MILITRFWVTRYCKTKANVAPIHGLLVFKDLESLRANRSLHLTGLVCNLFDDLARGGLDPAPSRWKFPNVASVSSTSLCYSYGVVLGIGVLEGTCEG